MTKLPNSSVKSFARQACALEESVTEEVQPGVGRPAIATMCLTINRGMLGGTLQPWLRFRRGQFRPSSLGRLAHNQLWPKHDRFRLARCFRVQDGDRQARSFLPNSAAVLVDA